MRRRRPERWTTLLLLALFAGTLAPGPPAEEGGETPSAGERERRVRRLLASDAWSEALEQARGFAATDPDDPRAGALLGAALLRAGRISESERVLDPLIREDRAPPLALVTLGRIRAAQGRGEHAIALMDRAVREAPDDRVVLYWAATATETRRRAVERLERYLKSSKGEEEDPDRLEGARGSIRVLEALGERKVWVLAERPERLELPLRPLSGGGGRTLGYVIDATAGDRGKRVRLLLDTGSSGLFLVHRLVRKRGFEPLAQETSFGGGGDRRHATTRGLFGSFAFGDLRFESALAATTQAEIEPQGRYHGVIGLSVFEGYRVTLDLPRRRLVLEPPPERPGGEPYWTFSGQMLVEAEAAGRRALFLLDTGAARSVLSLDFAESVDRGLIAGPADVRGFGGRMRGARVVRGIEIGFQQLRSSGPLNASDLGMRNRLGGIELSGFIGMDLLADRRIVIDTRHRTVHVEP